MTQSALPDNLAEVQLTPEGFPAFYRTLLTLRFPLPVAEVLELRDLINHSTDRHHEPASNPELREFQDSLGKAIQSFGIDNARHHERLLRILSLLRDLHYHHSIASRDREQQLRAALETNQALRTRSVRHALLAVFGLVVSVLGWIALSETEWLWKFMALGFSVNAWLQLRRLPRLDHEQTRFTQELNELLRRRIDTLNWRMLIHKLAMLLGFKQVQGIEVFVRAAETEPGAGPRRR